MSAPVLAFSSKKTLSTTVIHGVSKQPKSERLSPFVKKIARLERAYPRGAAVIEKIVDDLLNASD